MADNNFFQTGSLLHKHILIGLTYLDQEEKVVGRKQIHGKIIRVSQEEGVVVLLTSGEEFALPPDWEAFETAAPGEYRLQSTGEVVINPDLISTWRIHQTPLYEALP